MAASERIASVQPDTLAMIIYLYPQAFAMATCCDSRVGRALQQWGRTDLLPPSPPAVEFNAETLCPPTLVKPT